MQRSSAKKEAPLVGIEHRADLRPFVEDEVRFEIDMCIGCDRCMRACPVPMSSMVNIADLNRATISDDITPLVARFTRWRPASTTLPVLVKRPCRRASPFSMPMARSCFRAQPMPFPLP